MSKARTNTAKKTTKKKTASSKKPTPKKKPMAVQAREILTPLIKKGDKTRKELKNVLIKKGITEATANVILSDSKNPKYNKFEKLVQEDKEGKYSFK
ncbi:hypothetical protein [Rhodohalobacter mucosus]|uniref:Uncharacterized protein n=1 Tax=Rhodohalobacter mucosus TaxID=2079485 RepID=A0A316TZL9_9BACT|nr:hypothetical protein [Rhodohalobacter mucosus]PWN05636.1 hypothetical protein DDZ15_13645 [Rhodohalobacter mucosus]